MCFFPCRSWIEKSILKTVYVTNLVFSLETIVLLYFVTTNKLDKAFFILITFLQEENLLSINVTDFPDTCCSYFRYFTFKLCVRMRLWNYGYNTHVFI